MFFFFLHCTFYLKSSNVLTCFISRLYLLPQSVGPFVMDFFLKKYLMAILSWKVNVCLKPCGEHLPASYLFYLLPRVQSFLYVKLTGILFGSSKLFHIAEMPFFCLLLIFSETPTCIYFVCALGLNYVIKFFSLLWKLLSPRSRYR